jgi:hypothetical protein
VIITTSRPSASPARPVAAAGDTAVPPTAPRLANRVDPELLGDVDERCLAIDRLMLQLEDCLRAALIRAAPHGDKKLKTQLAVARMAADDLRFELGDLGLLLLDLRDVLNRRIER